MRRYRPESVLQGKRELLRAEGRRDRRRPRGSDVDATPGNDDDVGALVQRAVAVMAGRQFLRHAGISGGSPRS